MPQIFRYCMVLLCIFVLIPLHVDADRSGSKMITLIDRGEESTVRTDAETVGELLGELSEESKVSRVYPPKSSRLPSGAHVFLYRNNRSQTLSDPESKKELERTRPEVKEARSWALPLGKNLRIRGPGLTSNSTPGSPTHGLELKGQAQYKVDDLKQLKRRGSIRLRATGYSPHALDTAPFDDGLSALGLTAGYGVVAVDPRVIPLGTWLYIEGYGYAIAADVGGDIKGKRIDLGFPDRKHALIFGTRWLTVHILG